MVDICWSCVEECGGRQRAQHPGLRRLHILSGWRSFLKNWWSVCRAAEVHRWGCGWQGDWPPSCSASKALLETARQSVISLRGKHRVAGNAPTRRTLITLAWQTIIWDSVTSVHTACLVSSLRQFRYPGEHWLFFFLILGLCPQLVAPGRKIHIITCMDTHMQVCVHECTHIIKSSILIHFE